VSSVRLRTAREDDYPTVASSLERWWDDRPVMMMLPQLFFRHFAATSLVAEQQDHLVGFLVGFPSPAVPAEAHTHFIGVDPALRVQGVGAQMYLAFFDIARTNGCDAVTALTSVGNVASQNFHLRMGFTALPAPDGGQVWPDWDGPGQHRVRFRRAIRPV
jgi:GNAT superfamily N-acetyltransferase